MTLFESWKQSLRYGVAGKQKLYWAVVLKGIVRTWTALLVNWKFITGSLLAITVLAFYSSANSDMVHAFSYAAALVLAVLASRSSVLPKSYQYLVKKKNHALVACILCAAILYVMSSVVMPPFITTVLLIHIPVYNPLFILWLFFYTDSTVGAFSVLRSFYQTAVMCVLQLPFMALAYAGCVFLDTSMGFVCTMLMPVQAAVYATCMVRVILIICMTSLLGTTYTLLIHQSFDRYFSFGGTSIQQVVHSLVSWVLIVIVSLLFCIPLYFILLMGQKSSFCNRVYFFLEYVYCWLIIKATLVPVSVSGAEYLAHLDQAIIIANHQSSLDIPLIVMLLKAHPHVWLAHVWLMRTAILRLLLPKVSILVDTDSPMSAGRSLLKVHKEVANTNNHIIIFPEGGRYVDGRIHDFFGGYVILAKKLQKPVVPVYIHGLDKVFPPKTPWVEWTSVTVVIGQPTLQADDESDETFNSRMQRWFEDQNQKMKES